MAADAVAAETELAEFGILGPLEVWRCGRAVPLGGPRQRAVLALLLLEAALEAGRFAEAAATLRRALGLWRGDVLADPDPT
jgi:hypothetical protein